MVINRGSSSLRITLFARQADGLHEIDAQHLDLQADSAHEHMRAFIDEQAIDVNVLVAHRVVHGGDTFRSAIRIDANVKREIEALAPLAPLHNPAALALINDVEDILTPSCMQIAVFDTAFFHDLPAVARTYALPQKLVREHTLYRFGFHGLAHDCMWRQWCALSGNTSNTGRLITLQLGSGASLAAIRDGRPLDTSMGFSPLEGLLMATRCGDLDPGILLYLQRNAGYDADTLETLLNKQSGLLGVSGHSADMRDLLESSEPASELAVEMFVYRLAKYLAAYLSVLGGADGIVFGGGIGEHSPAVRARVLARLAWCGVELDKDANVATRGQDACLSRADSRIPVWVVRVREDRLIAQQALALFARKTVE